MKVSGIYKIVHVVTGRCYVGQSVDVERRLSGHKKALQVGVHHSKFLQRCWDKHHGEGFIFEIIENCHADLLNDREQFWIDSLPSNFNMCKVAASVRGLKHSIELKERMKGNKRAEGCKRTPETLEKMRSANLGKVMSQETKDRISKSLKGRRKSDETRERMRKASTGRRLSEETKAKIGAASKGRIPSAEARQKMSAARKGKKLSPAAIANMKLAQQASWAKRKEARK